MKLFVWDFHGVLEKGNEDALIEITNLALKQEGYERRMSLAEAEFLAGRCWIEYFAYLLPDARREELLKLYSIGYELTQKHPEIITRSVRLNDHAEEVLHTIRSLEYTQVLISNTQPDVLDFFVRHVGIEGYFPLSHRFGVDRQGSQSVTKQECLKEFIKEKHFPKGMVTIGDSPNDMTLMHLHPKGIGYLYSHPGRVHRPAESHYKINDLRCILQEV